MPPIQLAPDTELSEHAQLYIPNRLDLAGLKALELALGRKRPITWLVEAQHMPAQDIHHHLQGQEAAGIVFTVPHGRMRDSLIHITSHLKAGNPVILLPHCPAQSQQLHELTPDILHFLAELELPLTPLFVSESVAGEEPLIQIFKTIKPSPASVAELNYAWMEGAAQELHDSPALLRASLPQLLMNALRDNPESRIINGVDETSISYGQMLTRALLLAKHLRQVHHCSKRMGILLPPGANAICANLACFLAGISPVNINYKLDPHSSEELIAREGIKRFLTDKKTSRKLGQYKWLNPRDFVFVDGILKDHSKLQKKLCSLRAYFSRPAQISKWLQALPMQLDDEALLLFSKGQEDGIPKATSISHRNLLAQLLQLQQQLPFASLNSTLSSHPYHTGIGLFLGLLLPLLSGQCIITYPIENKIEHLAKLIGTYGVELAFTSPSLLYQLMEREADHQHVKGLRYLISSGELLNAKLRDSVEEKWGLTILNAYSLTESGALVSIEEAEAGNHPKQSRTRTMCSVGQVLQGTAVRIGNPYAVDLHVGVGQLGSLWLKGPSVANSQQGWINTGDIASLSITGQLSIEGRRMRFSRIGQELIAHQAVEQVLYRYFKLPTDRGRQLAVIGVIINGQERLVMLTSAHRHFEPNDQVTMRYGISNMKYPFSWSPSEVILINTIPQLSNGQLDYKQCCRIAYKTLGYDEPEAES
ncbi:MAG: AMP-binding protein [Akkermansia sp.]